MLKTLNRELYPDLPVYPERMIQFGGGNFMRAFVDWQLQQLNKQGRFMGSVVMVKSTDHGIGDKLNNQNGLYTVLLDGIEQGAPVHKAEIVSTISRVIHPNDDYRSYLALAEQDDLEFITSNTTEAGIVYLEERRPVDQAPASFPAKLTALLYRRYELGKSGFVILPCELIDRNGEKLRELVLRHAENWRLGEGFTLWLNSENTFTCTLVDRIVSGYPHARADELNKELGYIDQLMVSSEPFLFWVIEGPAWLSERLPLDQAGLHVIFTDDMTPYRERKVHLLNGPHTAMVPLGLLAGLQTVEEVMNDEDFAHYIRGLMNDELIPMLSLPHEELCSFADAVVERFRNPSIRHELASISLNSISKFKTRLLPLLLRYQSLNSRLPSRITLAMAALLLSYRGDRVQRQDAPDILERFDRAWLHPDTFITSILEDEQLWGQDLTNVPGLTAALGDYIRILENKGARAALHHTV
ncbi:tagaturonate reductase [Paenibacillus sp. JX-17]|uniref:Tagaturonate reductase n=1 Tax=Paenibacillus lacisoli TaxID=3064525 RepID=A0ABT9C9J6_9BACL|nr:tagaturonate reductase [Paenibacillus sp. JX-17]MDO7905545.1 tagaturonate reductase [Paenibacillus sp. JX-17]